MTADDLDARLATLPDDASVTVTAGDLRSVMHELRSEADAEIERWMDAVNKGEHT
jgi:predicted transcriptional regulator